MKKKKITNAEFAKSDSIFQKACEISGTPITRRQASKWRNNKGLAHRFKREATPEK